MQIILFVLKRNFNRRPTQRLYEYTLLKLRQQNNIVPAGNFETGSDRIFVRVEAMEVK